MSHYFPEIYEYSGGNVKFELNIYDYASTGHLK